MASTITESKFSALKAKLRELFELDKSDLDFGIYRIMAAKNKDVTSFLDRHLRETVQTVLVSHGVGKAAAKQVELNEAIQSATALGVDPETVPKVKELKEEYERLGGGSPEELEADIYNHLLNFFSRYYDEGDFISKRYYRGDTYAIPYGGEEVTLHWANKDQYYIKSGEWHKDYRFRIGDRAIHFRLVTATQETGNNKEPDESKRRYILSTESPVEEDAKAKVLTLRFEFRAPTDADKARIASSECTRVFGGKFDSGKSPTKGDEREQFCADAEMRALAAMSDQWKSVVTTVAATDAKPARTLLGKHLDHFTARNSFDYFIHKDLGGFLSRELDFYIKNEVVRLDDLEALDENHLIRVQGKVKAIRHVARRIIDFLANIEDFQKKLWLKKKFVLETNWLISAQLLDESLLDLVSKNEKQWTEWEALGFGPQATDSDLPLQVWGTRDYLNSFAQLVVNTRLYTHETRQGSFASIISDVNRDGVTSGVCISGDSFHALRLIRNACSNSISCVYIDPPYNTGSDGFAYKDGFSHSSWMSLVDSRLGQCMPLLNGSAAVYSSIDDRESYRFRHVFDSRFGANNFVAEIVWQKRYAPDVRTAISDAHEYLLVYAKSVQGFKERRNKLPLTEVQTSQFRNPDEDERGPWKADNFTAPGYRPNQMYEITLPSGRVVEPPEGRCWGVIESNYRKLLKEKKMYFGADGNGAPAVKRFLKEMDGMVPWTWWSHKDVGHSQDGIKGFMRMFGREAAFLTAKPPSLICRVLEITTSISDVVMDFFAGSGTTAEAVISMNRKDQGKRSFILVDIGSHFARTLLARVAKSLYSSDWNHGKAIRNGDRTLGIVKYFAIESYEDALNNLPSPDGKLFETLSDDERHALITYSLDLELGPQLLNMAAFKDPWGYKIYAQLAGDDEVKLHNVDLVETFNYLIGLKVQAYGPMERYSAKFQLMNHGDDLKSGGEPKPEADRLGRTTVDGRLRRDADGPYVFQRIEGELNDDNATRVLVIWRKLSEEPDKDAAALEAWMQRHREDTKERSQHRDYHIIYINGPVTLPQPTQDIRTVFPLEQTFKDRMFEDTE